MIYFGIFKEIKYTKVNLLLAELNHKKSCMIHTGFESNFNKTLL